MRSQLHIVIGGNRDVNLRFLETYSDLHQFCEAVGPAGSYTSTVRFLDPYLAPLPSYLSSLMLECRDSEEKERLLSSALNAWVCAKLHRQPESRSTDPIVLFIQEGDWLLDLQAAHLIDSVTLLVPVDELHGDGVVPQKHDLLSSERPNAELGLRRRKIAENTFETLRAHCDRSAIVYLSVRLKGYAGEAQWYYDTAAHEHFAWVHALASSVRA